MQIQVQADGISRIEIEGVIDKKAGLEFADLVSAKVPPASAGVLVDLRRVTKCTLMGRAKLRIAQIAIRSRGLRTAYLVDSPLIRGAALIVVHNAEDPHAGVVLSLEAATRWLQSSETRRDKNDAGMEGK